MRYYHGAFWGCFCQAAFEEVTQVMKERTGVLEALRVPPLECCDVSCHPLGRMGFRCQVKSKEVQENCNQVVVQQLVSSATFFFLVCVFFPFGSFYTHRT